MLDGKDRCLGIVNKFLEMLMVCTGSKFEENLNQTFSFTPHLHINSYETNIQVLPRFTPPVQIKSKFRAPNLPHICSTRKHE